MISDYDNCIFTRTVVTSTYPRYGVNCDILWNYRFSKGWFSADYLHVSVLLLYPPRYNYIPHRFRAFLGSKGIFLLSSTPTWVLTRIGLIHMLGAIALLNFVYDGFLAIHGTKSLNNPLCRRIFWQIKTQKNSFPEYYVS